MVLHGVTPPFAVRGVDNTALVHGDIRVGIVAPEREMITAVQWIVFKSRQTMHAEMILIAYLFHAVRSIYTVGDACKHRCGCSRNSPNDVILAFYLVHVRTFTAFVGNGLLCSGHNVGEIGVELCKLHIFISPAYIGFVVIIEEYAQVVKAALHLVMSPFPVGVAGIKYLRGVVVDIGEDVVGAFMVHERR